MQVSAAGSNAVHRTAQECEIRWLGERHPDFDRSVWSADEITKVKELVGEAEEGDVDWVEIATKLGVCPVPGYFHAKGSNNCFVDEAYAN
jgi:hypothetical protein